MSIPDILYLPYKSSLFTSLFWCALYFNAMRLLVLDANDPLVSRTVFPSLHEMQNEVQSDDVCQGAEHCLLPPGFSLAR